MKKKKKQQPQENLFISTQTEAQQKQEPQIMVPNSDKLDFKVEDIFRCPIYLAKKPEWVKPLNKASDPIIERVRKTWKKKIKDPKDSTKNLPNSYHSELLWQYSEFQPIANLIMQQSWNILSWQGYNLAGKVPLLTELWVQEFPEEGGFHDIHAHGNNHISGFYFLKCSNKTSRPVFHDPRPGKIMSDLLMKDQTKINYGSSQIHYNVEPGTFIFFNSYMPHAYIHHKGSEKFRFIHFNLQVVQDPNLTSNTNKKN